MKKFFFLLFVLMVVFFPVSMDTGSAFAQCSMCRAVAESAQDENNIAAGLNSGILYLLAIPYLLIGGLVVFFFKKPISEKLKSLKK